MKTELTRILVAFAWFGSAIEVSNASSFMFDYEAIVTNIIQAGDLSLLPNAGAGLVAGQTIHGSFTYDSASPSVSLFANTLDYSSAALSIVLPAATLLGTGPIRVSNDASGQDRIDVFGPSTDSVILGGTHRITTQSLLNLTDSTNSVFNSLALPTVLNLSDFDIKSVVVQEADLLLGPSGELFFSGRKDIVFEITSLSPVSQTPLPATLPLFTSGLGVMGMLGWRRKRKATVY